MNELDQMLYGAPTLPWLWPTAMARARAAKLQDRVRTSEERQGFDFAPETVRQAAVHTRQDLVLLVGLEQAIHSQLVNISRGVWVLAAIAGFLLLTR